MKYLVFIAFLICSSVALSQPFDTSSYNISVELTGEADRYFTTDPIWRGADDASSIDLENGKVLWLFSDSFVGADSSGLRNRQKTNICISRNSGY